MRRRAGVVVPIALLVFAATAASQTVLSLEQVQALARRQSPDVLVSRAREPEAAGRLTTAQSRLPANPDLDAFIGTRGAEGGGRTFDLELAALQRFEVAGQRGFRVAAARAGIGRRRALTDDAAAFAVAEATRSFYGLLHAQQAEAFARTAESVANEVLGAAQARFEAGEIPVLDVNVARMELARARQQTLAAVATRERAIGELRALLAITDDGPMTVAGSWATDAGIDLPDLLQRLEQRPDLQSLRLAITEAEAEWQLAKASGRPDVIGGVGVKREETHTAVGARIGITLPVFRRNAGPVASASARIEQARLAVDARRLSLESRLRGLFAAYQAARRAVDVFQGQALPSLEDNEQLARESYDAGKIGLIEYLLIRRESLSVRQQQLDTALAASLASVDVRAVAGVLR